MIVLSQRQVTPLFRAWRDRQPTALTSLDLNLTQSEVELESDGVHFPDGQFLPWEGLEEIRQSENACFVVEEDAAEKVQYFSPAFNRTYSLMPTDGAPTMIVAGFPMHRIKNMDPHEDTQHKLRTIAPNTGPVLDTTTGLGYTAIGAAKTADHVITVEIDSTGLEVARRNPWSRDLFDNPKIEQVIGDSFEVVPTFEDGAFTRIFHDPPTFKLAGQLYSEEFYRQLHRVLRRGGRLFHYIGDPNSPYGHTITKGAIRRLQDAGFNKVVRKPEAFGVAAYK